MSGKANIPHPEPWPVESFGPSRAGVLEDSAVAFSGFLAHISDHSKAFVDWNSEDVFLLTIIPMISEGSSVLRNANLMNW